MAQVAFFYEEGGLPAVSSWIDLITDIKYLIFSSWLKTLYWVLVFFLFVCLFFLWCNKLPWTQWLKQFKFIILTFWISEFWHGSYCAKIKVYYLARLYYFLETLQENSRALPFPDSRDFPHSLAHGLFLHSKQATLQFFLLPKHLSLIDYSREWASAFNYSCD